MKQICTIAVFAALMTSCSSLPAPNPNLGGPPGLFTDFGASQEENSVTAHAKFETNAERVFDYDLLDEGIVAIYLTAQAKSDEAEDGKVKIDENIWEPRLFLQDGTALEEVPVGDLKEISTAAYRVASENRFAPGFLGSKDEKIEGYLFFKLEVENAFEIDDKDAQHSKNGFSRGIDLYHSLLTFKVIILDESYPIFVGVKPQ
jgi:hypothetical protein